jgi:hypothetical protein
MVQYFIVAKKKTIGRRLDEGISKVSKVVGNLVSGPGRVVSNLSTENAGVTSHAKDKLVLKWLGGNNIHLDEAARALMEERGYDRDDVQRILRER